MSTSEEKVCLECNKAFGAGRRDRKFCSSLCRSSYHNRINLMKKQKKEIHEKILNENYRILKSFFNDGKSVIRKSSLDERNFNFNYFTTFYKTQKNTYFFIFDIGFAPIMEKGIKKLLVVNYQEYMKNIVLMLGRILVLNLLSIAHKKGSPNDDPFKVLIKIRNLEHKISRTILTYLMLSLFQHL